MAAVNQYLGVALPKPLQELATLALDMRWSWSHGMDKLWETIDSTLWHTTGNPWLLLQTVSRKKLETLAGNPAFLAEVKRHVEERRKAVSSPSWLERHLPKKSPGLIGYFSMEFGLSEALPLYSGGLGVLAGDYLKTASDLGMPVIGIGLLYQQGYFRQALDAGGRQTALFPYNDPMMLPVMPLRAADGEWLRISLPWPGRRLMLRCWEAVVGRNRLYLLDANDPANSPSDRGITAELYGGNAETRLQQELALGVGGWLLLDRLGRDVRVCHLNEGHAAFVTLARVASLMKRMQLDFDSALAVARSGTLFTTHTPEQSAFDRFPLALMNQYLGPLIAEFGLPLERVLELGKDDSLPGEPQFNMAVLAVHTAGAVNAVSAVHEAVSRRLFAPLFPRWPFAEIPIGHVTNGVHVPSWDSRASDRLWTDACGKERWRGSHEGLQQGLMAVPDKGLWECRCENRRRIVDDLTRYAKLQMARRGMDDSTFDNDHLAFDPDALTLGFARRFTSYKRTNLLLREPERLTRLLDDPRRPVQLVLAGKADPRDQQGLRMIEEWTRFIDSAGLRRGSILFVEDYDMAVASALTAGVDVWINTPRRPWEACGTSGMKVLVNGGLNLSVLDGWWAEAYDAALGWAIGGDRAPESGAQWDRNDAQSLYELLENSVVPEFFERDESGIPRKWVARMRTSMARLTPQFSGNRMLREYLERYYTPLAKRYTERLRDEARLARELAAWHQRLAIAVTGIRMDGPRFTPAPGGWRARALVYLDGTSADDVQIELYADPLGNGNAPERVPLRVNHPLSGSEHGFEYEATLSTSRPPAHYTLRACPHHAAAVPLECPLILWGESGVLEPATKVPAADSMRQSSAIYP